MSGSNDGEIKIWESKNGALLATIVAFKNGEWVTYTPGNYYISSPGADKYISFRRGNKNYGIKKYSQIYKKEGNVARVLKGEETSNILTEPKTNNIDNTQTSAPVVIINNFGVDDILVKAENQTVNSSQIKINATVVDTKFGIGRIIIQLNDRTVAEMNPYSSKEYVFEYAIILKEETNKIKITAYNTKNVVGYSKEINLTYKEALLKGKSFPPR